LTIQFNFDNSYARQLDGFYIRWQGAEVPSPAIVKVNEALAGELQLDPGALQSDEGAAILAGALSPAGATPLAQAYAGHQFGGFSPRLGDGRALLVGELIDRHGQRRDLHLKGSGRTPFSRGGDGKAVLGPVLREYLLGEAMYALGIPTSRALAVVTTGETIQRDAPLPGAVLARVAASHLRVGTFQFFAAQGETEKVRQLADYAIARHYPALAQAENPYLEFLRAVCLRQAALIAQWMTVGFVHGVMNTDNMAISGETIDYGPCAFIDHYDRQAVFSSIDRHGRYAFGNQPTIAQWNLARLAETLLPLIDDNQQEAIRLATNAIKAFGEEYTNCWLAAMRAKLGLVTTSVHDLALVNALYEAMDGQQVDFTQLFCSLSQVILGNPEPARLLFADDTKFATWVQEWLARTAIEDLPPTARAQAMNAVNPIYIPRNHKVEEALQRAVAGDLTQFEKLLTVLVKPFTERAGLEAYADPAPPEFGSYTTFCGT
jgi:uncharacterized protein YdiU (UPF0061 family)